MKFRSAMSLIDIADLAIPEMVLRSITQNPKLSFLSNVAKRSNGTRKITTRNFMNKKHGVFPEPGTIQFERLLPGPAEKIWDYLTKSELKKKWLSAGDVEPRVGGKVEFKFKHKDLSESDEPIPEKYKYMEDGTYFEGRVTEWDPPRRLSYTWGEETGEESEVTYELIPKNGDKVLLILTHVRLGEDPAVLISVGAGWHTHLGILADRLNRNEPPGFWKVHNRMEKEYEQRINGL